MMKGNNEIRFNTATMMSIVQSALDSQTSGMMHGQVTDVTWNERDKMFVVSIAEADLVRIGVRAGVDALSAGDGVGRAP